MKFPERVIPPINYSVPVLGMLTGLSLVSGYRLSLFIPFACLFIFTGMVLTLWGRATKSVENCGCYGPLRRIPLKLSLAIHLLLLGGLAWCTMQPPVAQGESGGMIAVTGTLFLIFTGWLVTHNLSPGKTILLPGQAWDGNWLVPAGEEEQLPGQAYLVFLNPECAECSKWISLFNVMKALDKHLSLGIVPESLNETDSFQEKSGIKFTLRLMPDHRFYSLIDEVPTAFKIENGIIITRWVGKIPRQLENEFQNYYKKITEE